MTTTDLAIIGAGPGGMAAAKAAVSYGLSVVLFEKDQIGGTCLNRGCIPTKSLLYSAGLAEEMRQADRFGISCENVRLDFSAMQQRKRDVVGSLREGSERELIKAKVRIVRGEAKIAGEGSVFCEGEQYQAKDIVIASGSFSSRPPVLGVDLPGVFTSDDLLIGEGKEFSSLIIVGGGVIGVEMASFYAKLGCKVSVLEMADQILPNLDRELARRLASLLKGQGIEIQTGVSVQKIEGEPGLMTVCYRDKKENDQSLAAQGVLIATGRRADAGDLFTGEEKPAFLRGAIVTDENGKTSLPHLYAIGDVRAGSANLAHAAEAEGRNVAAVLAGEKPPVSLKAVPACIYTDPEAASVGMSEEAAKAAGISVLTGKALTGANGKCAIEEAPSGYVKVIAEKDSGRIIGAQLLCPRATDLVAELSEAVALGQSVSDFASVIHPHPTFSEMISEAVRVLAEKYSREEKS